MVGPAWCDLLGAVKTEWNDHRGCLSTSIDAFERSNAERTADFPRKAWQNYSSAWQRSATCCFGGQNILGRAELASLTPPAVFTRHCSFRLPLVSGDDSWPGWAALHFLWGMQKMGEFLDRLKRPRVLRTWNPYVARKMGKGCSKRRPILWIKYIVPIFHNKASNFEKPARINYNNHKKIWNDEFKIKN